MNDIILEVKGLEKSFGRKKALKNLSFSLERGRIVGLLGPNGSGKTTLIKLLCGLLRADGGSIRISGMEPGTGTKRIVSYLPDRMYVADWMRVSDLMKLFSDFYKDFRMERAEAMLKSLGIDPKDRIKTMSKGTKEKVQLIMVMSREAELYLLDEPIGGVDPAARDFILKTILTNYSSNATVLISTHLISDVEKVLDEVILLREGEILRKEPVDQIREEEGRSVDALFRNLFSAMPEKEHSSARQNSLTD